MSKTEPAAAPVSPTSWIRTSLSSTCFPHSRSGKAPLLLALACAFSLVALPAANAGQTAASSPMSASPEARTAFTEGLAALHLFEYEDANEAFRRAEKTDPGFAMAYWG